MGRRTFGRNTNQQFETNTSFGFPNSAFVTIINTHNHYMLATSTLIKCNCQCQPPLLANGETTDNVHPQEYVTIDSDQEDYPTEHCVVEMHSACDPACTKATCEPPPKRIRLNISEKNSDRYKHAPNNTSLSKGAHAFQMAIPEQPNHVCCSCSKLFYKSTVSLRDILPLLGFNSWPNQSLVRLLVRLLCAIDAFQV